MAHDTVAPLRPILTQACITAGHNLAPFRFATTVALRKSGKGAYYHVGSYTPIALLPIVKKSLGNVVAKTVSWATETYNLLPHGMLPRKRRAPTFPYVPS